MKSYFVVSFFLKCIIFNYVYMCMWVCALRCCCLLRLEASIPLELEVQKVVSCLTWVLGLTSSSLEENLIIAEPPLRLPVPT